MAMTIWSPDHDTASHSRSESRKQRRSRKQALREKRSRQMWALNAQAAAYC